MIPTVKTFKMLTDGARREWRQSIKKDMLLEFHVDKSYGCVKEEKSAEFWSLARKKCLVNLRIFDCFFTSASKTKWWLWTLWIAWKLWCSTQLKKSLKNMHNCNRQNSMIIKDIDSEVRFLEVECVGTSL